MHSYFTFTKITLSIKHFDINKIFAILFILHCFACGGDKNSQQQNNKRKRDDAFLDTNNSPGTHENKKLAIAQPLTGQGMDSFLEQNQLFGKTALMDAAEKGYEGAIQLLLKKGAEVDEKDYFGQTALMYAAEKGHTEVLKLLLDKGADFDREDKIFCQTALIHAARMDI
jgi:ankyrin repeat protein